MKTRWTAMVVAFALLGGGHAAVAADKAAMEEALSADGLQRTKVKGLDLAYVRPGESLAGYDKVQIDPVSVSFRKGFAPTKTGSRVPLEASDLQKIRDSVAKIVHDEFVKELGKGQIAIASGPGAGTLEVRASITDLYVNAPDTMTAGRATTYTMNAGEMSLVMELIDSQSGQVIARVYDRRESREIGTFQVTNSVTNSADAANAARSWARILRKKLEAARAPQN
jgi:Protein of unknown function (DUF3313)